jgi:phosphotransferase system HPr-like phosphotransfer protein
MFIPGQVRNQHGLHERFVSPALQLLKALKTSNAKITSSNVSQPAFSAASNTASKCCRDNI